MLLVLILIYVLVPIGAADSSWL